MPRQLVVTKYADDDILNIASYLQEEWGNKIAESFLEEFAQFLSIGFTSSKCICLLYKK